MLPAQYRLSRGSEISETIRRGSRSRRGGVVVHLLLPPENSSPDRDPAPRAAFAVGKSVGDSVTRHRVVRRLRALTPSLLEQLPRGSRVVVRAMPQACEESSQQLQADLEAAFARLLRDVRAGDEPVDNDQVVPVDEDSSPHRSAVGQALWILGAPVRWVLIGLVWLYRLTVSPLLPPTCRFHPSCSAYGLQALKVHGAAKGSVLAAWRVLRCNPWNLGGLDPVPRRGAWRPDIWPDGRVRTPAHTASSQA